MKRMTIADYQAANQKLIEERATLTTERNNAREDEKQARDENRNIRKQVYALMNGGGYGMRLDMQDDATYMQIAARAGELVATERFFNEMKRGMFAPEDIIEGRPTSHYLGEEYSEVKDRNTGRMLVHNLPKGLEKELEDVASAIVKGFERRSKRNARRRRVYAAALTMAGAVAFFLVGFFGVQLLASAF